MLRVAAVQISLVMGAKLQCRSAQRTVRPAHEAGASFTHEPAIVTLVAAFTHKNTLKPKLKKAHTPALPLLRIIMALRWACCLRAPVGQRGRGPGVELATRVLTPSAADWVKRRPKNLVAYRTGPYRTSTR